MLLEIGKSVQAQQSGPAHMSEQLHESYAALHEHVDRQYQHLTETMGISHETVGEDPTPTRGSYERTCPRTTASAPWRPRRPAPPSR